MTKDRDTISMIPNWQIGLLVVAWTITSMVVGAALVSVFVHFK